MYKKGKQHEVLIEVANSRSSEMDPTLIETENSIELRERDKYHLIMNGTLSEQKRFVQNQNIKIKRSPVVIPYSDSDSEEHN